MPKPLRWLKGLTIGGVVTVILAVIGLVADVGGILGQVPGLPQSATFRVPEGNAEFDVTALHADSVRQDSPGVGGREGDVPTVRVVVTSAATGRNPKLEAAWSNMLAIRPEDQAPGEVQVLEESDHHMVLRSTADSLQTRLDSWRTDSELRALEAVALYLYLYLGDLQTAEARFLAGQTVGLSYADDGQSTTLTFMVVWEDR